MSDETPWNHYEDESLPVIKNETNDDMVTDDDDDGDLAGSFSNVQIEAIFSRAQRFRRTAPVATTWDDTSDSGSDAEVVGMIHPSDQPWFDVHECKVVRELALDEVLDEFEDAYDLDIPLKLRPFMASLCRNFASFWPIESPRSSSSATFPVLPGAPSSTTGTKTPLSRSSASVLARGRPIPRSFESYLILLLIIKRYTITRSHGLIQRKQLLHITAYVTHMIVSYAHMIDFCDWMHSSYPILILFNVRMNWISIEHELSSLSLSVHSASQFA